MLLARWWYEGNDYFSWRDSGAATSRGEEREGLKARQLSLMAGLSPSVVQMIEDEQRMPGSILSRSWHSPLQTSKAWLGFGKVHGTGRK